MGMILARETKRLIDETIYADQGGSFREWSGKIFPHMDDAFRGADDGFRSHMGASLIGSECARDIWYGFRWATKKKFDAKLLRLFNRGHLEEARFIAMLLMIGCKVYQQDANGKQFRISDAGGHFGGSGDGVVVGCPDVPQGAPAVIECKTHSDKSFAALVKQGVRDAKPEHYVQMNVYMRKMGIAYALYMAVNKNNDDIHLEIVHLDIETADAFINRGVQLVFMDSAPKKLNQSPGYFKCKWCDHRPLCHLGQPAAVNCRTCAYSRPEQDGTWVCANPNGHPGVIDKERQLIACDRFEESEALHA